LNWKYLPKWIKPFLKWCWTVSFNLFGLVFGSGMIDDEVSHAIGIQIEKKKKDKTK
jgi:hypothetical protein